MSGYVDRVQRCRACANERPSLDCECFGRYEYQRDSAQRRYMVQARIRGIGWITLADEEHNCLADAVRVLNTASSTLDLRVLDRVQRRVIVSSAPDGIYFFDGQRDQETLPGDWARL